MEEEKVTLSTFSTFPRPGVLPRSKKSGCRRWSMETFIVGAREHLVAQPTATKKNDNEKSRTLPTASTAVTSFIHTKIVTYFRGLTLVLWESFRSRLILPWLWTVKSQRATSIVLIFFFLFVLR